MGQKPPMAVGPEKAKKKKYYFVYLAYISEGRLYYRTRLREGHPLDTQPTNGEKVINWKRINKKRYFKLKEYFQSGYHQYSLVHTKR